MPVDITTRTQAPNNLIVDWLDAAATREAGISNYNVSCVETGSQDNPITMA